MRVQSGVKMRGIWLFRKRQRSANRKAWLLSNMPNNCFERDAAKSASPLKELRLLAGMEALNGLLLIGWSASYTYIAMERFWNDDGKGKAVAVVQPGAAADAPRSARR